MRAPNSRVHADERAERTQLRGQRARRERREGKTSPGRKRMATAVLYHGCYRACFLLVAVVFLFLADEIYSVAWRWQRSKVFMRQYMKGVNQAERERLNVVLRIRYGLFLRAGLSREMAFFVGARQPVTASNSQYTAASCSQEQQRGARQNPCKTCWRLAAGLSYGPTNLPIPPRSPVQLP